ncbi:branched-chain amino acid transporter permease [Streptomyces sp. NBC_01264]|uniref:branched-chain amino acid transporter permease n=1 Tax=Streptomyces sp. NBC_01264 TaxID=2903804 RepID=UPI00224D8E81|nr:AzlD domain-containing protein [Streptomyces sp. NBC_01264]MCX4778461.1 AzlD domain-containing protein [Streptomyces sp. NBC_01264]
MSGGYLIAAVAVMAAVTLALRAAPFVMLQRVSDSPVMRSLGGLMPPGVMVILVLYSVSSLETEALSDYVPAVGGIVATAAAYHWKRNALLGIVTGTCTYMALLRLLG